MLVCAREAMFGKDEASMEKAILVTAARPAGGKSAAD
jgi:hypothetical protein